MQAAVFIAVTRAFCVRRAGDGRRPRNIFDDAGTGGAHPRAIALTKVIKLVSFLKRERCVRNECISYSLKIRDGHAHSFSGQEVR